MFDYLDARKQLDILLEKGEIDSDEHSIACCILVYSDIEWC